MRDKLKPMESVVFYDSECYVPKTDYIKKSALKEAIASNDSTCLFFKAGFTYLICGDINGRKVEHYTLKVSEQDTIKSRWWFEVSQEAEQFKQTNVYAHFHNADVLLTDAIGQLKNLGWTIDCFSFNTPFFITFTKDDHRLQLRDSMAIFSTSVASLGDIYGYPKGDCDHFKKPTKADIQSRIDYCHRDVAIIKKAILDFQSWLLTNKLGNLKMTAASTAYEVFTKSFLKHPIKYHDKKSAILTEREAYHGGRTEAFKLGTYENIYGVDINSMYPSVMLNNNYPTKLLHTGKRISNAALKKYLSEGKLACIICKLKTDIPAYAKKSDDGLIFPVGEFYTGLCTPEIIFALENHHIKEIISFTIYEGAPIFKSYIEFFYSERLKAKENNNIVEDLKLKLFLNALYGKFGQIAVQQEIQEGIYPPDFIGKERLEMHGKIKTATILYGDAYLDFRQGNTRNTFVAIAAHVTAYARMLLFSAIHTAGLHNCIYSDTDSIYCNQEGIASIEAAGLIHPTELGAFKVEYTLESMTVRGCKDYSLVGTNDKGKQVNYEKVKGVSIKRAEKVSDNTYITPQLCKLTYAIKQGSTSLYGDKLILKELKRIYKKGTRQPDGTVQPLNLNESFEDYRVHVREREVEYYNIYDD